MLWEQELKSYFIQARFKVHLKVEFQRKIDRK